MDSDELRPALHRHWTGWAIALTALCIFVTVANRPSEERLDKARKALAEAGFPHAIVMRSQAPGEMSKCKVGQIYNRGYAYAWSTADARGTFCMPIDGRSAHIVVDRARAAS